MNETSLATPCGPASTPQCAPADVESPEALFERLPVELLGLRVIPLLFVYDAEVVENHEQGGVVHSHGLLQHASRAKKISFRFRVISLAVINPSGPVEGLPGETWSAIYAALQQGSRGLPGGLTLGRLFRQYRGDRFTGRTARPYHRRPRDRAA